jgi:predicted secreted protein
MPAVSGINFTLSVAASILGGQRNVTLNFNTDLIDVTSRDDNWWMTHLPGLRSWTIDFDGLYLEDDAAEQALEDAYMNHTALAVIVTTPAGNTYTGSAILTSYTFEGPYSAESVSSGTLNGSGALVSTAS